MPRAGSGAAGARLARARAALQRRPAWLFVPASFAVLALLVPGGQLLFGESGAIRLAGSVATFVLLILVLTVRGRDGWTIYGALLLTGFGVDFLPVANEVKAVLQMMAATLLVYMLADRGWHPEHQ